MSFVSGEKDEFLRREYQSTTGIAALQEVCQSMAASTKVAAVEGDTWTVMRALIGDVGVQCANFESGLDTTGSDTNTPLHTLLLTPQAASTTAFKSARSGSSWPMARSCGP